MSELLTHATFAELVGDRFQIQPPGGEPVEVVLTSCTETPHGDPEAWKQQVGRMPFSLLFHADAADAMPQQTFTLRHERLGELEVFLVPIGPDERGMRYEAVFS
jgi:hypothetical protein